MKPSCLLPLSAAFLVSLFLTTDFLQADTPATPASVWIANLRCEYLVNPMGIDAPKPRLTWSLQSSRRGETQTAYQVLVASSPELLAQDKGDLWDSGQVKSDQSALIDYGGSPLTSRQACCWKVRTWDSQNHVTAWSEPARWEMGLLQPEDWQAKWLEPTSAATVQTAIAKLEIVKATYEAEDKFGEKDVTELVAKKLKDNALEIFVDNKTLDGDPTPLHKKQLRVNYTFGTTPQEAIEPEGATLTIPSQSGGLNYLRKDFTVAKPVAKARLYATALGLYVLHLNGQRVGDHLFAPDWTDYDKRVRYQVYDVTSLLTQGSNTLGGMLGNGWYAGHIGNGGYQAWGKIPALFAQLEVTYQDGTAERVITDGTWKVHPGPVLSADYMLGENVDARKEITGWDRPGLDLADWSPSTERTEAPRALDAQVCQPVRELMELKPKTLAEPKPGRWTYDFGQNMVGVLRLKVNAPAGTKVTLRHAEMLNADGTLYTTNLRGAPSIDTYICKGGGEETWQPSFTFHGFRYAEISGLPDAPTKETVTGIVIGTDIPRAGEFSCSDADINQLQSNIQWGMRGNYLSVPTDCPQRDERMGWMGDAQVFIKTAAYNGDVAAFFTKWLVDVDDAQSKSGVFTNVCPSPHGRGGEPAWSAAGSPAWSDAGVICPWTIYVMYGDRRILEQHLPAMTKWIEWCRVHSTNLIRDKDRGSDYGDWLSQGESASKDLIGTAYFAYSTSLVAKAYRVTGDQANADKYQKLFEEIRTAFQQKYVLPDGKLKDPSQCATCMALRFDLLPKELRAPATGFLAENVAAHHDHLTTGFVGVSYLLPSLCSEGDVTTAYRVFLQTSFPSWLFSVKHGATTIWERWDGWTPEKGFQNPGMNSFNHYSLGSCGEWMFDTVAGIGVDPEQPGFKHILIQPRPGGTLTQAEGTYDSIHGRIASKWKIADGVFSLAVTIPANTTATVTLPAAALASLKEGDRAIANCPEIKTATNAKGNAELTLGSGDYAFTCTTPWK